MTPDVELVSYTDGGARGNPGPAAIGVVIKMVSGTILKAFGRCIGETTNNQAEYRALIAALEEMKSLGARKIRCLLDSELVVKQLNRQYRVKDADLQPLFVKVWNLSATFEYVEFKHIAREENKLADFQVNQALDQFRSV